MTQDSIKKSEGFYEEALLSYGVDFKNRAIYFGCPLDNLIDDIDRGLGDVDSVSVSLAIRALALFSLDTEKPVRIYMSSFGGDIYTMFSLYDVIKASPCKIIFYGSGMVMSAASIIMCACDERYLYPNTTVMLHAGSTSSPENVIDTLISVKEDKRFYDMFIEIYSENSIMPKEFWKEVCKRDLFLTANESIALGLADEIVSYANKEDLCAKKFINLSTKRNDKNLNKLISSLLKRIESNSDIKFNQSLKELPELIKEKYSDSECIKDQFKAELILSIANLNKKIDGNV